MKLLSNGVSLSLHQLGSTIIKMDGMDDKNLPQDVRGLPFPHFIYNVDKRE